MFLLALLLSWFGPATAPAPRIDLLPDKTFANWTHRQGKPVQWKQLEDGSIEVAGGGDVVCKINQPGEDFLLHVEFMIPQLPPDVKGQDRGNSGVYLLGRYEVQILDSHGLTPTLGDCGAIYSVAVPAVNAAKPAGQWQTYDITFRSPRWDMGRKVQSARISVVHNGQVIHSDVEVPKPTGSEIGKEEPGPLPIVMLQDHGTPVRFRNIWVAPLEDER
jgi:hypothetical protein